jgi:hypothetical protein
MQNPFVFTRPLDPEELIDREAELNELREHVDNGVNVRLTSPRDYGKTSLLGRALWESDRQGWATVRIDLYGARTPAQIAMLIERAYDQQLKSPVRRAFDALKRRGGGVSLQGPGAGGSLTVGPESPDQSGLLELLDLPAKIHKRTGVRFAVAFDEFQVVLAVGGGLDGLMRSVIQLHGDAASYVFAGSHPGMMRELFADKKRPFYGQAAPLELGRLPNEALADHISDRFNRASRDPGAALGWLLDLVDGHPQRAMLMAHLLFEETARGTEADEETWGAVLERAWPFMRDDFERTWDGLSPLESGVVEAVAAGVEGLTSKDTRARFNLPVGSGAPRAAQRLADRGLLRETQAGSGYELVDPVFARWVSAGRRWG